MVLFRFVDIFIRKASPLADKKLENFRYKAIDLDFEMIKH